MMTCGEMGEPPVRAGVPYADLCTPLFCVIGVLSAIHELRRTGVGQRVDVSMLGVLTNMVSCEPFDLLERCGIPPRTGLTLPRLAPFGVYPAADGYIALCARWKVWPMPSSTRWAERTLRPIPTSPTAIRASRTSSGWTALVAEFTRTKTKSEVVAILEKHGVPSAEVRKPGEAVTDPRVVRREETVPLVHPAYGATEEVYGMGVPIRFSESQVGFDQPPPGIGQHNAAVYGEMLGYSNERIDELRREGVI